MWLKTVLTYCLIILDVMVLPFSCSGSKKSDYYIFSIDICDETHDFTFHYDSYAQEIPSDLEIEFKEDWEDWIFEHISDYEIVGWSVGVDPAKDAPLVQFPYTIQEEDYISYYCGYRHSVVFTAQWEYIGDAN